MAKRKNLNWPADKSGKNFKMPSSPTPPNYELRRPIFSFKYMPYQKSYCISKCQKDKKSSILDKILRLSQSTWAQIRKLGKEAGFETIPRHRFKVTFPSTITPDVNIKVARYDGDGGRFAGFKINDIFHIVLVGKDLYPH